MPKIETVVLRSRSPNRQRRFYCDILGMTLFTDDSVGYAEQEARLYFPQAIEEYMAKSNDLYWKIALAVPNIELAYQQLISKGVQVSLPHQFQDVGYLAHFTDPEGFTIELIEHWFQGRRAGEPINSDLLGGGAHFNLLTLRADNVETMTKTCVELGMKPLCIQPVESHGFTLYFFAFTSDTPPSSDLRAIENREWLYQRKYTVLEIQHIYSQATIQLPGSTAAGYAGTVLSGLTKKPHNNGLFLKDEI